MTAETSQAIYGIIFSPKKDQVLLIQRRDVPVWVLPGGGLEKGEDPKEAVVRELQEETGYQVRVIRQIAEYLPVNKLTLLSHFYECEIISGEKSVGEETKDIRFFPLDNLPKLMPPPYEDWIRDAEKNTNTVIKKKIEGVSYWVLIKLMLQHPILVGRFLLTKLGIHINT